MPPFKLESTEKSCYKRIKTTLFSQKTYSPGVKITGWETYSESLPVDINPYSPNAFNLHYSHYNRIGVEHEIDYTSTTKEMLQQLFERRRDLEVDPHKAFINLYSEIDNAVMPEIKTICTSVFSEPYRTTMQHHYQPPYSMNLKRLSMPETPYFLNRRLKNTGLCKFLDDDYVLQTKRLQKAKSRRCVSYNPGTGRYSEVDLK